jgi:hypothetical protein
MIKFQASEFKSGASELIIELQLTQPMPSAKYASIIKAEVIRH